jgi:hypothetical protein
VEYLFERPRMRCSRCNKLYEAEERRWKCDCGGALDLLLPPAHLSPNLVQHRPPDLWRYREALPPLARQVSLGETITPFIPITHRGRAIWLKCDYLLPTGSYKDRGAAILISQLQSMGVQHVVEGLIRQCGSCAGGVRSTRRNSYRDILSCRRLSGEIGPDQTVWGTAPFDRWTATASDTSTRTPSRSDRRFLCLPSMAPVFSRRG